LLLHLKIPRCTRRRESSVVFIKMDDGKMLAPRRLELVPIVLWIGYGRLVDRICSNELFRPMLKQTDIQRKTIVKQSKSSAQNRAVLLEGLHLKADSWHQTHGARKRILLNPRTQIQSYIRCCQPMILDVAGQLCVLLLDRRCSAEINTTT